MRLFLGFIILSISVNVFALELSSMAWLEGRWANDDGVVMQFTSDRGGKILGLMKMTKDDEISFYEFTEMEEKDGKLVLTPSPFGHPGVEFTADKLNRGLVHGVVFKNLKNDFPKTLSYHRLPDGSLWLRVQGVRNGKRLNESFTLTKL